MSNLVDAKAGGGTGARFGHAVIIVAGLAALAASLLTVVSVWLQAKNYRKPLLQRYVIRILLMVPIYSGSSFASLMSMKAAFWVEPFRDVYEAFTIYTFLQLLINFIGGERALITVMYGRKPVSHLWPLSRVLPKVDISDPHTFLAIKRGILQYTWMKPLLSVATIIMKSTGVYQEGYIGVGSGYLWTGIIYNVSITISLYALAMFWVCMSADLQPFRPVPKFLCVKGIIFASYWQGFFLSILVFLGFIPDDVPGYTSDNLAAAIQDALICFEMPAFAVAHWYAFSWHDYADVTISAARMPVKYALRDAFGPMDLIMDTKQTFSGGDYEYRNFNAHGDVLAHEDSTSRTARLMAGMRYERGGKGKYWVPQVEYNHQKPLLGSSAARTMSPGAGSHLSKPNAKGYGTTDDGGDDPHLNPEEERLYDSARGLEFGDWNYPVITAHTADREARLRGNPTIITASTNRHLLQPTTVNKQRRRGQVKDLRASVDKGKQRESSDGVESSKSRSKSRSKRPLLDNIRSHSSSSSAESDRSQLVDLVVEDHAAEEVERVRARKEGGAAWNEAEPKHFVHVFADNEGQESVREGFDPSQETTEHTDEDDQPRDGNRPFTVDDGDEDVDADARMWRDEILEDEDEHGKQLDARQKPPHGSFREEREAWGNLSATST